MNAKLLTGAAAVAGGAIGLAAGMGGAYKATSWLYREDVVAKPTQKVGQEGDYSIERPRPKTGPLASLLLPVAGVLLAVGGGAWATRALSHGTGAARLLQLGGAIGLIGLGGGIAAGSAGAAMLYQGTSVQRD